ncbi:response regulator [Paenibacillus mesophilus]|uniref:response regulator n=1 Tax=Paenibacillus mesophilus TaxID=2582849 RepID=UPI00110F3D93|nr:response regulator [Paenibacillus mesophilus]TMV46490.1 response regulator [Paenibacillus mesophilus]
MLKILLVDDEVAICKGMKKLIMKADGECSVVEEAYDGVEALDIMKEFDPDILLTDMRMPRMDGLQLLREAKKRKPDLLTAVLSAYSDYEYIREAMLMNASDYLLKPATGNDLQDLLQRLKLRHRQLMTGKEREALELLLRGVPADNCPSTLQYSRYALLLVCVGPYINGVTDMYPGDGLWQSPLFADCSERFKERDIREWILNGERPNEQLILLAADDPDAESRMRACLDDLLDHMKSRKKPVTIVAASGVALHQLYATSKRLRRELLNSLVFGKSHMLHLKEITLRKPDAKRRFAKETVKVMEVIEQKRYELFADELNALLSSWESGGATQHVIQQTLFRILAELGDPGLERQIDLEMLVSHSLSYAELKHNISLLFHDLFESPDLAVKSEQVDTIVGQVEQYLKKHFRESITLQSLSQEFGLVPNYLSVLFKREIGVTPLEYLLEFRIKEAKRIMDERPHLLLKQVASEVGYQDQLYFSRVFKKQTGQSPSEYAHSRGR